MKNLKKRGFTLIELLVVVLIIAILAAVALPQYNKVVKKAQGTEALTVIDALDKAMQAYYLEHGTYQGITAEKLNVDIPQNPHIKYAYDPGTTSFDSSNTSFNLTIYQSMYSPEEPSVRLLLPNVYLHISWNKGKLVSMSCGTTTSILCSEYFNCNATPRTCTPTGSAPYCSGGGCTLK